MIPSRFESSPGLKLPCIVGLGILLSHERTPALKRNGAFCSAMPSHLPVGWFDEFRPVGRFVSSHPPDGPNCQCIKIVPLTISSRATHLAQRKHQTRRTFPPTDLRQTSQPSALRPWPVPRPTETGSRFSHLTYFVSTLRGGFCSCYHILLRQSHNGIHVAAMHGGSLSLSWSNPPASSQKSGAAPHLPLRATDWGLDCSAITGKHLTPGGNAIESSEPPEMADCATLSGQCPLVAAKRNTT